MHQWLKAVLIVASVACPVAAAAPAAADETHVFNAQLSLTGNCTTSDADPVPDPGCPGGAHPPSGGFKLVRSTETDEYGNLFLINEGKIDIFDVKGFYRGTVSDGNSAQRIAIDSDGRLYVYENTGSVIQIVRYDPDPVSYDPENGIIKFGSEPMVALPDVSGQDKPSLAIDRSTNRFYLSYHARVEMYGSAEEGNQFIESFGEDVLDFTSNLAVNGQTHEVYVGSSSPVEDPAKLYVFSEDGAGYSFDRVIDGACTATKGFRSNEGFISPSIEEATGHVFVDDRDQSKPKIYEFTEAGDCVSEINFKFLKGSFLESAIDNGTQSPETHKGMLFAPSGEGEEMAHVFAFKRKGVDPPAEIVPGSLQPRNVTSSDAELLAEINPNESNASYFFEVVSLPDFEESGFAGALVSPTLDLAAGTIPVPVSVPIVGLLPGTDYRFRLHVENECEPEGCPETAEGTFSTYAGDEQALCPNDALRAGLSANLPDCRAYELVTPPETNGHAPLAIGTSVSPSLFGTPPVTADGASVSFVTVGGTLPGFEAAGGFQGDGYLASRGDTGWKSILAGPTGAESSNPAAGGLSPDHQLAAWTMADNGSLAISPEFTNYVRYPDGSFHLIGEGTLGVDYGAAALRIAAGGSHTIFRASSAQLEPNAAPAGTTTIYDRTADGETHVVSLLPGEEPMTANDPAVYRAASDSGTSIAFTVGLLVGSPLYVRHNNAATTVASEDPAAVAEGFSADGRYFFFLASGTIYRWDLDTAETMEVASGGNLKVANVSRDGSHVYFLSTSTLTPSAPNPQGDEPQGGSQNFYGWSEQGLRFIGTVTQRDVEGEEPPGGGHYDGLGLWAAAVRLEARANVPAQTSEDGNTLLFKSRADLTGYDSNGLAEVFRYSEDEDTLRCISCSTVNEAANAEAGLVSEPVLNPLSRVSNLAANGKRAFFETAQPLVQRDNNGVQDVYEWEAKGIGSCGSDGGCLYLISSGESSRPSHFYGASVTGDDVFISTADRLVTADPSDTPSIYDARVGGGFADASVTPCLAEGCRALPAPPPSLPNIGSSPSGGSGNVPKRCPKGKRKVVRHGKVRCIKRKHRRQHKRTSQKDRQGGHR